MKQGVSQLRLCWKESENQSCFVGICVLVGGFPVISRIISIGGNLLGYR